MLRILVETGFLLALNPRDRHHKWALGVLEDSRKKMNILYISPIAPAELSLIMRSKGFNDKSILRVLKAIYSITRKYTKPRFPLLELEHIMYAAELRIKYPELTFFDSIHASLAILNNLVYYDLDKTVKKIVDAELESSK